MNTPFHAPCTLTYDDDGSTAALTLVEGTPHVSIASETYYFNAAQTMYRTTMAQGGKTLVRNGPPGDPGTGDHNGRTFTLGE